MSKYSEMAMIFRYSTSVWGATKTDRKTSDEVTTLKKANRRSGKFVQHLLAGDCPELKAIQNFVQNFHLWIRGATFPSPRKGEVIVPNHKVLEIAKECREYQKQFFTLVNRFLDKYEDLVEHSRIEMGDLFQEDSYPSKDALQSKFNFDFGVIPIADSNAFDKKLNIEGFEQVLARKYEERMDEMFERGEEQLLDNMRKRLLGLHETMVNFSGEGKGSGTTLGKRTFASILKEVDTIKSLNIRKRRDIEGWCQEATNILSAYPAHTFRTNASIRNRTVGELETLLTDMGVVFTKTTAPVPAVEEEVATPSIEDFSDLFAHL